MEQIQLTRYANATKLKFKNRRVGVTSIENNEFIIELKTLCKKEDANTPHSIHKNFGDKIVVTGIKVSSEAALSILIGLREELKKAGVIF